MKAVLLHNIRSAYNVGAILRTADAAGIDRVYLSGYTPAPVDRFKRPNALIAKTALGAERFLPWERAANPAPLLERMRRAGSQIIGVEQDARARSYRDFSPAPDAVFVFGNEVRGLSPQLRGACDVLLEIPMRGRKESLNVSVAAGIILFSCLDQ